jgi:FkbM family methyltransferase
MAEALLHAFPPVFELQDCRYGRMLFPRQDQYVGRSLGLYGEFSEGEASLFRLFVAPGQVVLDVGANIGAHTVLFARAVGPTGLVLAFEPQRILHQVLCANLALNGISSVITEQAGLGRNHGTAFIPPLDYGQALNFGGLALDLASQGESVPVRPLDAYQLQSCAFIKIDVEGMEAQVLEGAADTLRRLRPTLYVENDRREKSPELIALLQHFDYRLWWHVPPLFNPDNFRGNPENVFPGIGSRNLLALPQERAITIEGLPLVTGPQDWPFAD